MELKVAQSTILLHLSQRRYPFCVVDNFMCGHDLLGLYAKLKEHFETLMGTCLPDDKPICGSLEGFRAWKPIPTVRV